MVIASELSHKLRSLQIIHSLGKRAFNLLFVYTSHGKKYHSSMLKFIDLPSIPKFYHISYDLQIQTCGIFLLCIKWSLVHVYCDAHRIDCFLYCFVIPSFRLINNQGREPPDRSSSFPFTTPTTKWDLIKYVPTADTLQRGCMFKITIIQFNCESDIISWTT